MKYLRCTIKKFKEVSMKRSLLLVLVLLIVTSVVFAETMIPGTSHKPMDIRELKKVVQPARPDTAIITFSVVPNNLVLNYYDYMIGSYNDLPLCVQPDPTYGGYFLTFHGKRTPTGQRRVFYSYINDNGVIENMNEITNVQNWEGYPGIAVDPVSGKPMYAWHVDTNADGDYEVQFAYDAFLFGAAGLISDPVIAINNPITLPAPWNTTNNEFIWPTVQIGPSPTPGMRRVYVLARNFETHTSAPSENPYIAYADFDADMLEMGSALSWSYTSIPMMNDWNHDSVTWRRPMFAFSVGNDGRIYYTGYHFAQEIANSSSLIEPDLDAFVCDNYGAGTWTRVTGSSEYDSWNPMMNYGNGPDYYFTGSDNTTPIPSDSLYWGISNSSHLNAAMDADNGEIHMLCIWAQQFNENDAGVISGYYHPSIQTVKNLVYDTNAETFTFREVYPVAGNSFDNLLWLPWDADGDGLVDEYYTNPDNPSDPNNGTPLLYSTWPFPYWDNTAHAGAMMFHLSSTKLNAPNNHGMMAAVWQDSNRARLYNEYPTSYPEYAAFSDTPEIWVSVSPDYGMTWSEPTSLNKVETPQLAGMKPMYVYPADKVKYVGVTPEGKKIGKLGVMFLDDITWGSYILEGPIGQNDGGYVRFMELEITFPVSVSNTDPVVTPAITMLKQNYPNPFNPETTINFNLPKGGFANLSVYNTKGQLVKTLVNGMTTVGDHKLVWNGKDNNGSSVASGLYFYKLTANGRTETRKMMLMK